MESSIVMGIDIGASHITAALVNLDTRTVDSSSRKRILVDARESAENITSSWCNVVNQVFVNHPRLIKRIGIAMPGPFNYREGISLIKDQDKFNALYDLNIKNMLSNKLAISPARIKFMNDASCFLQGEYFCGSARNRNNVLGVTLGTGLGAAICRNGITEDADLWNTPFKNGIAEDYLATRWFLMRYKQLTGKHINGVKELRELADADEQVKQVFKEFGENFAVFLNSIVIEFGIQVVVLGGNISNAISLFLPSLKNALTVVVELMLSKLGEEATLIGAASCWKVNAVSNNNY